MSDAADGAGARFSYEIDADDNRAFRKIVTRDMKPYIDRRLTKGIAIALLVGLSIPLLIAGLNGQVTLATVLIGIALAVPKAHATVFREMPAADRHIECVFTDDAVAITIGPRRTTMPWSAIARVENAPSMVIFWYQPTVGFLVPSRAFIDDAARNAFAAWATLRVSGSRRAPVTPTPA